MLADVVLHIVEFVRLDPGFVDTRSEKLTFVIVSSLYVDGGCFVGLTTGRRGEARRTRSNSVWQTEYDCDQDSLAISKGGHHELTKAVRSLIVHRGTLVPKERVRQAVSHA